MTEDLTKLTLDQIKENLKKLTPAQIEAYNLALSAENNDFFKDKIKKFEEAQNQEFNDSMGSYRASSKEKENFQNLLSRYLINVENTHRSFFEKKNEKANGQLKFANGRTLREFYTWLVLAGIANTEFTKFKREFKDKVRDVLRERSAQTDRNAKKNKRRLKGLGAILAAGALGTAAVFGTKAVMEKFQNSEDDDAKTDRIEHRVNIPKTTVQQRGYVQDAIEETVIIEETRHQTEEVRQPQKVIETVVVEKEVPKIVEKTVVVEKEVPVPVPVPQPTIEHQVEANTVAYQTAMTPAPTTYVQPAPTYVQPATTVIPQQPAVTVIDNSSPVADFVGAAAGAFVGQVIADRLDDHHHGHGRRMKRSAPPPSPSYRSNVDGCAPNIRMDRPHKQRRAHQKINCAPKPYGGIANIGHPQAGGNSFFRPKKNYGGGMSGIMKRGSNHGGHKGFPKGNHGGRHGKRR